MPRTAVSQKGAKWLRAATKPRPPSVACFSLSEDGRFRDLAIARFRFGNALTCGNATVERVPRASGAAGHQRQRGAGVAARFSLTAR